MKIIGKIGKMEHIKIDDIHLMKKLLISHFRKYNKMSGMSWLQRRTDLSKDDIYRIIRHLRDEGFLMTKNDKLIINPEISLNNPKRKKQDNFNNFIKNNKKKIITQIDKHINNSKIDSNNWINILRYLLLIIGIGAVYMSIYYSDNWLREFLNPVRSLLLATIMVAFAVSAFELIILFKQRKKYFLIGVFSVLWITVTIFSMMSTVAGQYNARIERLNQRYKEQKLVTENERKYQEYREQKEEYQERRKILSDDIRQLQTILSQYTTKEMIEENQKQYNAFRYRYYNSKKELNNISNKLKTLRKSSNLTVVKKSPPDFYLWISRIFGWSPEMIQFWLSVFPAIFIDLIAPIAFAIVMFIRKEK